MAAGLCPLVGPNGLLAQDWFILSLGQRGNLTQQHVQENAVGNWISPSLQHSKAEKEEEEERGLQGDGPRRRSMESKAPISKLLWGMDFPVVTSAPHCHQTIHAHVNPPVPVLYPLLHGTASPPCVPRVCKARGGTRCCCHVLPAASIPAAQPSLVCHFVMGNVRQLAAQASDCFLGFAFSFIYYSFFLLVLDVCKSSCFEL